MASAPSTPSTPRRAAAIALAALGSFAAPLPASALNGSTWNATLNASMPSAQPTPGPTPYDGPPPGYARIHAKSFIKIRGFQSPQLVRPP